MLVRKSILTILIVAIVGVGAGFFGGLLPAGFIPEEDQGILGINVTMPPGASLERTSAVLKQVEDIVGKTDGVESYQTIGGYGVVTSTYQPYTSPSVAYDSRDVTYSFKVAFSNLTNIQVLKKSRTPGTSWLALSSTSWTAARAPVPHPISKMRRGVSTSRVARMSKTSDGYAGRYW